MIRSGRIPSLLQRICDDDYGNNNGSGSDLIQTAILCTLDGELLGSTTSSSSSSSSSSHNNGSHNGNTTTTNVEHLGTLIADIAVDYGRLGEEYTALDLYNDNDNDTTTPHYDDGQQHPQQPSSRQNTLQCLFLEMEIGLVGVSSCPDVDCLIIVIASLDAPLGNVKLKLQTMANYVTDALGPLTEDLNATSSNKNTNNNYR